MHPIVHQRLTPKKLEAFLEALSLSGRVDKACAEIGCSRDAIYYHRRRNPDFAAKMEAARIEAADLLEDEAFRRAHQGIDKPVFQGKELVGVIREYSDTLLIFLLKGCRPDKYRDRVDTRQSGEITVKFVGFRGENGGETG